jgi:hypothetical protein
VAKTGSATLSCLSTLARSENRGATIILMAGTRGRSRVRVFECSKELLQSLLRDLEMADHAREVSELYSVVVDET